MVKSLTAIAIATAMLLGLALFEWFYVADQFADFGEEVQTLYDKAESGTANAEDARAVQTSWETRKSRLHIWIPHNDVNKLDDYLAEAVRLIGEREYPLALAKLEILLHLAECIPGTYRPHVENIF